MFQPHSPKLEDVIVAALKRLGGIAKLTHILEVTRTIAAPASSVTSRDVQDALNTHSPNGNAFEQPGTARDLFCLVDNVKEGGPIWALSGFLPQAPQLYPIAELGRARPTLVTRRETGLYSNKGIAFRVKGVASPGGAVVAIQATFSSASPYPNELLADGTIIIIGEGLQRDHERTGANRGMIEAGVARYPIPVFQYVARDRYAYLGEYLVSEYPTADVQLRTGTRINALRFRLTPASSWTKERYVSDREVEALAIDAGLDLVFSREGRTALREHLARERSPGNRLVVIRRKGLRCEACTFHFGERFGPQLEGFIEVHHVRPLASGEYEPTLDDFVVLCANCHRAAHHRRGLEPRTVNELKALLSLQAVRLSPAPALSSLTRSI